MTHAQRNSAILDALKKHTTANTVSKTVARKALIAEGIYTQKGELRVEFGGKGKKAKSAA